MGNHLGEKIFLHFPKYRNFLKVYAWCVSMCSPARLVKAEAMVFFLLFMTAFSYDTPVYTCMEIGP